VLTLPHCGGKLKPQTELNHSRIGTDKEFYELSYRKQIARQLRTQYVEGIWLKGHSRSLKLVPFESLGAVSYWLSIVTMAVSVAVCEIFSAKEWCDLESRVTVRSRSLAMTPFDRSHTSSHSLSIVTMALYRIVCEI